MLEFARRLIHLRRTHRVLRQRRFFQGSEVFPGGPKDLGWIDSDGTEFTDSDWHSPTNRTIGMYLAGRLRERDADGNPIDDDSWLLLLHAGADDTQFVLPGAPWGASYTVELDTALESIEPSGDRLYPGHALRVTGRSAVLLRVTEPAAVPPAA
jgi:glycogen operon protein